MFVQGILLRCSALVGALCAALTVQREHRQGAHNMSAAALVQPNSAQNVVAYEVTPDVQPPGGSPRLLHIALTFGVPVKDGSAEAVSVQMPVWCPGDYHVQNFARYVQNLRAFEAGADGPAGHSRKTFPVAHPDANTWTIQVGSAKRVAIAYDMPETPPGYFSENVELRDKYAFINGASALVYLVGRKDTPITLTAHLPTGWQAETPLPLAAAHTSFADAEAGVKTDAAAPQTNAPCFAAPDYDTLADSPLLMADKSAVQTRDLSAGKNIAAEYRPVYFGNLERLPDTAAVDAMLMRLARAETRLMGGPPNPRYDFFFEINGRGGGLEHLNACRIPLRSGAAPQRSAPFIAHEFFHQWNIKRIRPRVLGPFDYVQPPRTRNLWFAEGVTEYYAHIATRRAGLYTPERFLAHWRRAIANMQRNPARATVTADQASWNVWEAGNSEGSGGLSYYDKGELIGLCLDLKIRHVTHNKRSLDDVMRALLQQCAFPHPGYEEDGLRDTINAITGENLSDFYTLLARSTQEMPFAECLAYAGLDANLDPLPNATPEQIALREQWTAQTE